MAFVNFFLPKLNWISFSEVKEVRTLGLMQQLKSLGKEAHDSARVVDEHEGVGEREVMGVLTAQWTWLPSPCPGATWVCAGDLAVLICSLHCDTGSEAALSTPHGGMSCISQSHTCAPGRLRTGAASLRQVSSLPETQLPHL